MVRISHIASAAMAVLAGMAMPHGHAIDLVAAYRLAQSGDPTFEAARYALEAGREKLPQARAGVLPTVNLNGNGGRQNGQASFAGSPYQDRNVNSWAWNLQLSQPVVRVASWIGVAQAGAQVEQAEAQFAQAESDLLLRTAQAYFDVLTARDSVTVAKAQLRAVEQQRVLAKRRYDVGEATITDVYEAQSRHDLGRSQLVQALNDQESRQAELEKLIGALPDPLAGLRANVSLPAPEPADVGAWMGNARENNPAVRTQLAAVEVAEKEVSKNRAAHLPTLDFTAGYGRNYTSGSMTSPADIENRVKSGTIGLQLTIPIYQGGAVNSRVSEAIANQYKSRAELEAARRQAATLARQAFGGVTSGLSQLAALTSAVTSSLDAVNANKIGYRIGTRVNIDVLNAEQQLFAAQRDLAKARYDTILQGLRLKSAAGTLAEGDVIAVNALLTEDASQTTPAVPAMPAASNATQSPQVRTQ
ncbi:MULTISPECIES: TolC family outer membrane protein [Cupriavidus]|uniref:Type I secretion protein TolC n=1 Tax=Cupriavidus oxalaticus TaxID=96344 RepID=A0A4P7LLU1_9BURK|nr:MULTISPECIES: TolC family outer membrane protein [Cupriavidus]MBF6992617.1 TolC family outer membrane protein [Cupriavidus sp. IK-TO18]QBY53141.1 type I secretion protein TolC [Cupriavidus oxalaticus]